MKPIAIDLCCGLGGWTDGLLAEGYDVTGYDIEAHEYDGERYPARLVLQDVLTLHGAQFKDAALIVASPPCQRYSYMAMPWTRAKTQAAAIRADLTGAALEHLNRLFNACFRIQREASEAAGHRIPMVVENVRGAQPWVGRAAWNFGSYYLWGDVPALMPPGRAIKVQSFRFDGSGRSFQSASVAEHVAGRSGTNARFTSVEPAEGKAFRPHSIDWGNESRWFNDGPRTPDSISSSSSSSPRRKAASAKIAKIPFALSSWIARTYHPHAGAAVFAAVKQCLPETNHKEMT